MAVVLVGLEWTGGDAHAQAWVGEKGTLDLALDYNLAVSDTVIGDSDVEFPDAGTTSHQFTIGAEYVPIPKLAVSVALPLVAIKYTGNKMIYPHPGGGRYDDGDYHATLTDLRAGARYQVLEEPVALSPHLAFSIPVADYETIGNAVVGRHLKALHMGLGVGRVFALSTYVHLLYEFSLVEKYDRTADTEKYGQNRSDIVFTLGHKLLDQKLDLNIGANVRLTHGGVKFANFGMFTPDEALYHDAILDEDIVLVGGGAGYQLTNSLSVTFAARLFVKGYNTQNASVFAFGVGWSPL